MASTHIVSLSSQEDRIARFAELLVEPTAAFESQETAQAAIAAAEQSAAGAGALVDAIIASEGALFASGDVDLAQAIVFCLELTIRAGCKADDAARGAALERFGAWVAGGEDGVAARLQCLVDTYNVAPALNKAACLVMVFEFAARAGQVSELLSFVPAIRHLPDQWNCSVDAKRALFAAVAAALETIDAQPLAQAYRVMYLRTFEGAGAAAQAAAAPVAEAAVLSFARSPAGSQSVDLETLDAVQALAGSRCHRLLSIVTTQGLAEFEAFLAEAGVAEWLASCGLEEEAMRRTLRLLTLASLGAKQNRLTAAELSAALAIDSEEIDDYVIEAVAKGLIQARIDEEKGEVEVAQAKVRAFGPEQWQQLQSRLGAWKSHVDKVKAGLDGQ